MTYLRKRKNTFKETLKRRKSLVYLLEQGVTQLQQVMNQFGAPAMAQEEFAYFKPLKKYLNNNATCYAINPQSLRTGLCRFISPTCGPL
jgi:hypothetical protein